MLKMITALFLIVGVENAYAQQSSVFERENGKIESNAFDWHLFKKTFLTKHLYYVVADGHMYLHHVSRKDFLIKDFSYEKYRVSELSLLVQTPCLTLFPTCDVFVLTRQCEYKKVFEGVIHPIGFPIFETPDGFYIFIADPIVKQWQNGQYRGTLWFVSRDGETREVKKLNKVVLLDNGYFNLLEKGAVYHVYTNTTYPIPCDKKIFQCGTNGKILLASRSSWEKLWLWDLKRNNVSPWKVDGRIRFFMGALGGGVITKKDGDSVIYSPDFHTFRDVGYIKGMSFWSLAPWPSLSNQWAILELEKRTILLDRITGEELLSAPVIQYKGFGIFDVEFESGEKRTIDFRQLK